jgi:p-cumate 2,3-dioxygenase beta subunit
MLEDFLYLEANLLDNWQLDEWLEILTDDAVYEIPATDVRDGNPNSTLFIVADDKARIQARVNQLLLHNSWAELPHSRTRRLITNVRVLEVNDRQARVTSNFTVNRFRHGEIDTYIGRYEHVVVWQENTLKIRERRAILDLEVLRPHGKISIIL